MLDSVNRQRLISTRSIFVSAFRASGSRQRDVIPSRAMHPIHHLLVALQRVLVKAVDVGARSPRICDVGPWPWPRHAGGRRHVTRLFRLCFISKDVSEEDVGRGF
ncbi:hypothetical protein SORBI_3009G232332 [Sorghum bicolor]|uniref:Uncharacterized protein n=1 Tax=Sorghum bicolor TaxID=4558 RepID=A0A1Z5R3R4_SORBI|nr:hypothetical protein SORBI_3009G232332 [Sorghum bicolor]